MSTIKTGTTLTTAYQVEGDTTGALVIQTGGTPTTAVTVGSDQNVTVAGNVTLNNGTADGAQLTLASSGYNNWNWDNYSGRLRAYYGSTEYFTIDSSGNVGIGTSSPSRKLEVNGQIMGTDLLASNSNAYFLVSGSTYGQITASVGALNIDAKNNSNLTFQVASSEKMRIDSSGNVGIGSTPGGNYKLEVAGRISISGSSYITNPTTLVIGQYSSTEGYIQVPSSGKLNIWDNGTANIASFLNNGNFQFNSGYGSVATAYGCRAWVAFNASSGSPSINASGNMSSITDNGAGDFTLNFATSMPDSNYSPVGMSASNTGTTSGGLVLCVRTTSATSAPTTKTTSALRVLFAGTGNGVDAATINVAIFR